MARATCQTYGGGIFVTHLLNFNTENDRDAETREEFLVGVSEVGFRGRLMAVVEPVVGGGGIVSDKRPVGEVSEESGTRSTAEDRWRRVVGRGKQRRAVGGGE